MGGKNKNSRDASFVYISFTMNQFSTISSVEIFREKNVGQKNCSQTLIT